MTDQELNRVRDLRQRIRDLERHLQALRLSVENLVPVIDGLPHSHEVSRRVEKLAVKIVDAEQELDQLREEMLRAKSELVNIITGKVEDPTLQTLLILRYVSCCTFKETARRMRFTLRYIFKLHEKILKEFISVHIATQSES